MIQWAPRLMMTNRPFRLVVGGQQRPTLAAPDFQILDARYSRRDDAWMFYLRAPAHSGDVDVTATVGGTTSTVTIPVRTLEQLRTPFEDGAATWPRRWPVGAEWESRKTRQTLTDPPASPPDPERLAFWLAQDDASLWRHLPEAEWPRAHYVNVHQGCPSCGTAIFAHHGFYPWTRVHAPADLRSTCPACESVFPSNDLLADDFSSGEFVDDGFGWFDDDNNVFLFAASSRRELVSQYTGAIRLLDGHLRIDGPDRAVARQLGLMLLRWSLEEVYVAAAPQFRHGPSQEVERPWDGGQPDYAGMSDPIASLHRKGSLAYAIDIPNVTEALAHAYDTVWPELQNDNEWVHRARDLGLDLPDASAALQLIEEALGSLIQTAIDGAALSNKPRTSLGVLTALRALDRDDATDVMDWLYDRGPDRLRVFVSNNFTIDGQPPEANGGYNDTHTRGLFELQEQVDALRTLHPSVYSVDAFPNLTDDPRLDRLVQAPYDMRLLGRIPFHFGDGGSAGVQQPLGDTLLNPLDEATLTRASSAGSTAAQALLDSAHTPITTVYDGVGIAILRTDGSPERAAAGIVYGDAPWHRHQDLLDTQLYAFDRPFLSDLGYPQSWAHVGAWEGNWATHNSVWSVVDGVEPLVLPFDTPWHYLKEVAGRGRLVRMLRTDGIQIVEVEAKRWCFDPDRLRWFDPGVRFRRLIALVETDGDGVALIDLSRIQGGDEHWRMCRGLEGELVQGGVVAQPQSGTLAGTDIPRGAEEGLRHPDHAGLAWMDDVHRLDESAPGHWTSRHDGNARLDLHPLRVSDGVQLLRARATAVMGDPESSRYNYQGLAWQRTAPTDPTCIDLLFEPHVGDPTLARVEALTSDEHEDAVGVSVTTKAGRQLRLYWSPSQPSSSPSQFSDGTVVIGPLAVVEEERAVLVGGDGIGTEEHADSAPGRMEGTIAALDRSSCTIDVSGLTTVSTGDRICINPEGRAHTYQVLATEALTDEHNRLTLDMASVHGRGRVAAIEGNRVDLDFHLITRTATLQATRLLRESDDTWRPISHAYNPDAYTTSIEVESADPVEQWLHVGDWVAAVDYVPGDAVSLEVVRIVSL